MKKLLLVGAGGLGRIVAEHASATYECAFLDDGLEKGTSVCGIPVLGTSGDLEKLREAYSLALVTIGNCRVRERLSLEALALGYSLPSITVPSAYISPFARVGKGCIILNNAVIQNGASVGDGVIINAGVEIHQDSTVGDYSLIYANTVTRSYSKIGRRVTLGSTITIGNNVEIPDDRKVDGSVLG